MTSPSVVIGFVPGAAHNGRSTHDGFDRLGPTSGPGAPRGAFAPGYVDTMTGWVHRVTAGDPPLSAAATPPPQQANSVDPGHTWWTSARIQLAVSIILILVGSCSLATHRTNRLTRAAVGCVLGSVPATLLYAASILATNAQTTGPIVASHPLPWLALQALATITTVLLAAAAIGATRNRAGRTELIILLSFGCLWLAWAFTWVLL